MTSDRKLPSTKFKCLPPKSSGPSSSRVLATRRLSGPSPAAGWVARLASTKARAPTLRVLAAVWFLLLLAASFSTVEGSIADIEAGRTSLGDAWPALLSRGCLFAFYAVVFCIITLRPEPINRARGLAPVLITFAGTYGAWLIPLLPRGPELPSLAVASAAILLVSGTLTVYTLLYLGRSFSLLPQARKLVTSGPYGIVRHPLYLLEEAAIVGVLLQYAWFAALPFLALHVSLQIRRMQLEEKILLKAFPEYAAYEQRTARLIPGVW